MVLTTGSTVMQAYLLAKVGDPSVLPVHSAEVERRAARTQKQQLGVAQAVHCKVQVVHCKGSSLSITMQPLPVSSELAWQCELLGAGGRALWIGVALSVWAWIPSWGKQEDGWCISTNLAGPTV